MKIYYFGCLDGGGHFLWAPDSSRPRLDRVGPWDAWKNLDATLPPQDEPQVEGRFSLHHEDGWTAIACWDRSVDHRGNSNSAFLADGTYTFDEMLVLASTHFPQVVQRMQARFELVLADPRGPIHPEEP